MIQSENSEQKKHKSIDIIKYELKLAIEKEIRDVLNENKINRLLLCRILSFYFTELNKKLIEKGIIYLSSNLGKIQIFRKRIDYSKESHLKFNMAYWVKNKEKLYYLNINDNEETFRIEYFIPNKLKNSISENKNFLIFYPTKNVKQEINKHIQKVGINCYEYKYKKLSYIKNAKRLNSPSIIKDSQGS